MSAMQERQLSLRDIFVIIKRRLRIVLLTLSAVLLLVLVYCALATREYESTATIQVLNESPNGLPSDGVLGGANATADAQTAPIVDKTEALILTSDTLALETISKLHLDQNWKLPAAKSRTEAGGIIGDPAREQAALRIFHKNLAVQPVTGTRVISISYRDHNPVVAAQVVNTLSQELINYTVDERHQATANATQWLSGQLVDLRKESQALQDRVVALQQQSSVFGIANADASGKESNYSGLIDQLQQATVAYNQAEQNSIVKGAIARIAESGDADTLSGLGGNAVTGSSMSESLSLIQTIRGQEATLRADIAEMQSKYGSAFPRLVESQKKLASLEQAVTQEVNRVKQRAQSDYKIAQAEQVAAKTRYDQTQTLASGASDKAAEYAIAREDALRSRTLYEDIVRQLKQANIGAELKSVNLVVVDPGRVAAKAKTPNIPLLLLIGVLGGLFVGICAAFGAEGTDDKVRGPDSLELETQRTTNLVLPAFPSSKSRGALGALENLQGGSSFAESVNVLRTFLFALARPHSPNSILVTSSVEGEGATVLSSSLAAVLSKSRRRVLLVDTDFRSRALSSELKLSQGAGLSELLSGVSSDPRIQKLEAFPSLDVLGAGEAGKAAAESLDSEAMRAWLDKWRSTYEIVILHASPVLRSTGPLLLAIAADMTLYVAQTGVSKRTDVKEGFSRMVLSAGSSDRLYPVLYGTETKEGTR